MDKAKIINEGRMSDTASANVRSPSAEKRERKTSAKSARLAGTSARSVEMLKTIRMYGDPELARKMASGQMSLSAAYQETRRAIIEARRLGLDVPAGCRIGGRIELPDTKPCPHCKGTGRTSLDSPTPAQPARRRCADCRRAIPKGARADAQYCSATCRKRANRAKGKGVS